MAHDQKAMLAAHQAGLRHARYGVPSEAKSIADTLPTQDERDAFLGGFHAERRRIAERNARRTKR